MGPDNVMLSLGGTDPIKRRIRGWGCSRVVVDWEISDTEGAMFGNRRMESEGLRLRSLAIRAQTLSGGAGVLLWAAGTTGRWRGRTASASDGTLSRRLRLPAAALRGSLCRSAGLPGPCDEDAASGEKEAVKDGKVRTAAFAAVDRSGAGAAGVAPQLGAPSVLGGPGVGFDG